MNQMLNCRRWRLAAFVLALATLVHCADLSGSNVVPCTGVVTLTATPALEPSFAWTPNCLVDGLLVEEVLPPSLGGPQPRWFITARIAGRGAGSPLAYGRVPAS